MNMLNYLCIKHIIVSLGLYMQKYFRALLKHILKIYYHGIFKIEYQIVHTS